MIRLLVLATVAIWTQYVLCGRFNLTRPKDIVERFGFMDWSDKRIEPRFNIAPSQEILTIVQEPLGGPFAQVATWGLKPFWLRKGAPPPINARAEALAASRMFREARRCLIPATGFYEWQAPLPLRRDQDEQSPYPDRQPLHIQLKGGQVFAFAGLWLPASKHGGLPSAAVVTTEPNELMATIHTRMPAILRQEDELRWLDPTVDDRDAQALLRPFDADLMEAYPVASLVNSWENEGPKLIQRVEPPVHEVQIGLPFQVGKDE